VEQGGCQNVTKFVADWTAGHAARKRVSA
jgi:hypothetical protein